MERALYVSLAKQASDLVDQGEYGKATEIFEQIAGSELPDVDKCISWVNLATVEDKRGDSEAALACLARALDYERKTDAYFIAQHRAAYLSKIGRHRDSLSAYRDLVDRPGVRPDDVAVFKANILTLEKLVAG